MDFISNQEPQIQQMLNTIGVNSIEDLFCDVPAELLMSRPENDDGLSEMEGLQLMQSLEDKNSYSQYDNYLGAGAYEHYVPALVGMVTSRSEFLTSYTPYQAEASQGLLQTIFEFQSAICSLTGLDVANASVYDGASACAESLLMAVRYQRNRKKVLIARSLHPHYRGVVDRYLANQDVELITIPFTAHGLVDRDFIQQHLGQDVAAILMQYPNFLGTVDDLKEIFAQSTEQGILNIVCANPLVYGLYSSAAELGADIAVGDCQPFGLSLNFGGPYAGYMSCRQELIRQLPGRLVGETVDAQGKRGFVLTLQAREQHIRREKATSNICTNQALAALASLVTMLWYGKKGIPKLALTNYQRTAYLKQQLTELPKVELLNDAPCLNEFALTFGKPANVVQQHFRSHKIEPGLHLGRYYPEYTDYFLTAVTETKNKGQLDRYVEVARQLGGET